MPNNNKKVYDFLFGGEPVKVPESKSLDTYTIPQWQKVAPTYGEAVQKVLDALKDSRSFCNYKKGKLDFEYLRETDAKREAMAVLLPDKDGFVTFQAQMGHMYRGRSVKEIRKAYTKGEFGLGAYEVGCILLSHPHILAKYEDLWIDCLGDEYNDPRNSDAPFDHAPYFSFDDDRLEFGTLRSGAADDNCGSASGFLFPQEA